MGEDMLVQCRGLWPGLVWRYESEFGRAVGEFDGKRLASVTIDRMADAAALEFEACVFGPPRPARWHGETPGAALSGAMAEALTRATRFVPPKPDTYGDWNAAIDAAVKEARHQRGANGIVGATYARQGEADLADRRNAAACALDFLADTIEAMKRPEDGSNGR